MRILIAEDEFICRNVLLNLLSSYGRCDVAVNGIEALAAFESAQKVGKPYTLICMDIKMPGMDGNEALKAIRDHERSTGINPAHEVKIIMTTALNTPKDVVTSYYHGGCTSYITKPIDPDRLTEVLKECGLKPERKLRTS